MRGMTTAPAPRPFDLIVFGATGFTGRLVAQYLASSYGPAGPFAKEAPRWALAGRSLSKLQALRAELGLGDAVALLVADASDTAAMQALVRQTQAVITTVGPYQLFGNELVLACAKEGTDYVDLCGEPAWMAQQIERLQGDAASSGARIVFSCGFDSIPFDLGVVYLQSLAQQRLGKALPHVQGRVAVIKGGPSGGTVASLMASIEAAARDPHTARVLRDPFALTPGFKGPRQPNDNVVEWDEEAQGWTAPFVMATINTKNVHRTNALRGHPWGRDFLYSERMWTGPGTAGHAKARALMRATQLQNLVLALRPARALARRFVLPKPGEGPTQEQRERGRYEVRFFGGEPGQQVLSCTVRGDRDPGYGSTCKLITEAALCLIRETGREHTPGGVWTAGAAMGLQLARRLQARAGLGFTPGITAKS